MSFSGGFSSGTPVRVFASINHGNESSEVHDTAFIWVEDVTMSGFRVCLVQGGQGNGGNITIDWFAFQGSQSGVYHGAASFSLFTTETKCNQVAFPQVKLNIAFGMLKCIKLCFIQSTCQSILYPTKSSAKAATNETHTTRKPLLRKTFLYLDLTRN